MAVLWKLEICYEYLIYQSCPLTIHNIRTSKILSMHYVNSNNQKIVLYPRFIVKLWNKQNQNEIISTISHCQSSTNEINFWKHWYIDQWSVYLILYLKIINTWGKEHELYHQWTKSSTYYQILKFQLWFKWFNEETKQHS